MARKLTAIAFSLGCLHASSVMALGLGEMELESFLNEPLKASVDLLNMGGLHGDEIKVRLGTTEDFKKLGLDRDFFLTNITFEVVTDGSGNARILITSQEPVLEPYLDFIIEARWPSGRLLREYTVLVDPPVFSQATPVVSASERVTEVDVAEAAAKKNEQVTSSGASQEADDANLGNWGSVGGGGTRVNTRGAELAPGAMPQRNYGSNASSAPTAGSRYMIQRDQTLWEIANQSKPTGVSVHQAMLEIQRLNPDAFINGNINRIKAGYIIYLPTADDVSSVDLSSALTEVRQQNEAFQSGRDEEVYAQSRPKLTISAEPEEASAPQAPATTAPTSAAVAVETPATQDTAAPTATSAGATGQAGDTEQRLAAMEQQLETLQRIVSLKDDQISALQTALKDAGGTVDTEAAPGTEVPVEGLTETTPEESPAPVVTEESPGEDTVAAESKPETAVKTESKPSVAEEKSQTAAKAKSETSAKPAVTPEAEPAKSWTDYILYILGAIVLAAGGILLARRRSAGESESAPLRQRASNDDVFSDVRLRDTKLEPIPEAENVEPAPSASQRNNRGYGERKHDEYASDIDAADALAEADIYIAYGRHPQAIDLLNNALANEPNNPVYRLKLLEIYTELNNRPAAASQLKKIQALGDPDSTARAEAMMEGLRDEPAPEPVITESRSPSTGRSNLPPNPLAMMSDSEPLEADFSGLEIESADTASTFEDDLDLSRDFVRSNLESTEDEELVIAADSNGLSTKLDLARAYLDMGDDDGARQILDEVVAEGSEELRAEARTLLNRIGG
jgi:pilus assembly protein FimV